MEELRQDFETFRREQQSELSEFALTLRGTSHKIMAAIRGHARIAGLDLHSIRSMGSSPTQYSFFLFVKCVPTCCY